MVDWWKVVFWTRIASVVLFLVVSLKFTLYSLLTFLLVIVSFYALKRNIPSADIKGEEEGDGTKRSRIRPNTSTPTIPPRIEQDYQSSIAKFALASYNPESNSTLEHFDIVKQNSQCIFAKKSLLWGAADYTAALSFEDNVIRSIPQLIKFLMIGSHLHLDGFVFELPGDELGQSVHDFARGVYRLLSCLSKADPSGTHCMDRNVDSKSWHFVFNREFIFVTTFAPCYPSSHSRYAHGADQAFVLLQPMYSFAHHDIGHDTPLTKWEKPETVRDKIRVAFKAQGRPYHIRDTVFYPTAHDIVKPLQEGGEVIRWWDGD